MPIHSYCKREKHKGGNYKGVSESLKTFVGKGESKSILKGQHHQKTFQWPLMTKTTSHKKCSNIQVYM